MSRSFRAVQRDRPADLKARIGVCPAEDRAMIGGTPDEIRKTTTTLRIKNGKIYDNRYAWLIEIKDGRIWKIREYMDTAFIQTIVD